MAFIPITTDPYGDVTEISLTGDQTIPAGSLWVVNVTPDVPGHTLTVSAQATHLVVNASATDSFELATTGNGDQTIAAGESATVAWDIGTAAHVIVTGSFTPTVNPVALKQVLAAPATDPNFANGNHQTRTLTADIAPTPTDPAEPMEVIWSVTQDGTGGWNVDFSNWPHAGTYPVINTVAGKTTTTRWYFDGSEYHLLTPIVRRDKYLSLSAFSPVGDGTTDNQPNVNAWLAEAEREGIWDLVIPPLDLALSTGILIPEIGASNHKRFRLFGSGCILRTMGNGQTVVHRPIASVAGAGNSLIPLIQGIVVYGQAANTDTAGTAFNLQGFHTAKIEDCDAQNVHKGFEMIWCMESLILNCQVQGSKNPFIITNGDNGRISDGTQNNSNSNNAQVKNCRAQVSHADAIALKVNCSRGFSTEHLTLEGSNAKYGVQLTNRSESGAIIRADATLRDIHFEFTTVLTTVFKLDIEDATVNIERVLVPSRIGTTPNEAVFLDDTDSRYASYIIRRCNFYNWNGTTDPWFLNQTRAAGFENLWVFEDNVMHPSTPDITDSSLWANTPPQITGRNVVRGTRFETF